MKRSLRKVRKMLHVCFGNLKSILEILWGAWHFYKTGRTPESAHQAMIRLFCITMGVSNDLLSSAVAICNRKIEFPANVGVLGDLTPQLKKSLVDQLQRDGCILFPQKLPNDVCERLFQFALTTPADLRVMDNQVRSQSSRSAVFDPSNLLAVRYDYKQSELLNNLDIQNLLADLSLLGLVQEYLGCQPRADVLAMWWHTNFSDQPDSEAAQFFHFDMDRLKWLKIFIYLTDVGPSNGPHSFVRGSHRTRAIPRSILSQGYARITDSEVVSCHPIEDVLSLTAPRGSIIIEDTRGLHKGSHVTGDPRLVLQLQFSNSLFGASYPSARFTKVISPGLDRLISHAPAIYRQYI